MLLSFRFYPNISIMKACVSKTPTAQSTGRTNELSCFCLMQPSKPVRDEFGVQRICPWSMCISMAKRTRRKIPSRAMDWKLSLLNLRPDSSRWILINELIRFVLLSVSPRSNFADHILQYLQHYVLWVCTQIIGRCDAWVFVGQTCLKLNCDFLGTTLNLS